MYIFELNIFWLHIAPSYYWLMYVLWFLAWYYYFKKIKILSQTELESLFFYVFLWVVLWWRLWYVIFYDLSFFLSNPISIIEVWKWWMSFHWWFLGVIISIFLFCKKYKKSFLNLTDKLAFIAPLWLFFGRIWNYINKELLWFEYNWFLAVEKDWTYYFPSPLLEAMLEWIVLFFIIFFITKKNNYTWKASWYFLIFYGIFRIFVELFFRMPDKHLWYIFLNLSMWSLLSIPMLILGIYVIWKNKKTNF